MKTYITFIIFLFFACATNKRNSYNNLECNFNENISQEEKKLNFESIKKEFEENGFYVYQENDTVKYIFEYGLKEEFWKRKLNKITGIEKIIAFNRKKITIVRVEFIYTKGNFNIGNEYFYNEKGEIIKTIDHNQYDKFPICYKEIINSTIKKADKNFYFQGLEKDSIKNNNENIYFWKVYFQDTITIAPTLRHQFFKIDAKTNKTLEENTF